jgi:hypothetical protein
VLDHTHTHTHNVLELILNENNVLVELKSKTGKGNTNTTVTSRDYLIVTFLNCKVKADTTLMQNMFQTQTLTNSRCQKGPQILCTTIQNLVVMVTQ